MLFVVTSCIGHRTGVSALGLGYVLISFAAFAATIWWVFTVRHACYGWD